MAGAAAPTHAGRARVRPWAHSGALSGCTYVRTYVQGRVLVRHLGGLSHFAQSVPLCTPCGPGCWRGGGGGASDLCAISLLGSLRDLCEIRWMVRGWLGGAGGPRAKGCLRRATLSRRKANGCRAAWRGVYRCAGGVCVCPVRGTSSEDKLRVCGGKREDPVRGTSSADKLRVCGGKRED